MEEHLVTRKVLAITKRVSIEEDKSWSATKKRKVTIGYNRFTKKLEILKVENCVTDKRKVSVGNNRVTKRLKVSTEDIYIPEEIIEQILVRLDVEDLIRCKSVCKSWKTLISGRHFIKAHQKYCFNKNDNYDNEPAMIDQVAHQYHCFNNKDNGQAMIDQVILPYFTGRVGQKYDIVGSSNGLVCINTFEGNEFSVANPWTREERIVQKHLPCKESCRGFGYDPVTNDYKIVFGVTEGNQTSFQVLSLKSNVWKHIGHVNGVSHHGELATLCNGALHWLLDPDGQEDSSIIISFDLSTEVFKEIPQPDDARYNNPNREDISTLDVMLGIKDECLCIWRTDRVHGPNNTWIMQKYDVQESWEPLGSNFIKKFECVRYCGIAVPDFEWSNHDSWFLKKCICVPTTTIMQSLISPYSTGD